MCVPMEIESVFPAPTGVKIDMVAGKQRVTEGLRQGPYLGREVFHAVQNQCCPIGQQRDQAARIDLRMVSRARRGVDIMLRLYRNAAS